MLVGGLLLLVAVAVAMALRVAHQGGGWTALVVVFCPEYERVVEQKGDQCVAIDDERRVSSIWDCQRSCVAQSRPKV